MRVLGITLLVAISSAAPAQRADSDEMRQVLQAFGKCVVSSNGRQVEAFLENPNRPMAQNLQSRLPNCLVSAGGEFLKGDQDAYRFALAEAYVVRKFRGDEPSLTGFPEKAVPEADPLETLGTCIVQKSPSESWALLQTRATSSYEKSAFAALMPAMKFCIRNGVTLRLDKFSVRGAVADAIYRYSKGANHTPGGIH